METQIWDGLTQQLEKITLLLEHLTKLKEIVIL